LKHDFLCSRRGLAYDVSLLLNANLDDIVQPWLVDDPESVAKCLLFVVANNELRPSAARCLASNYVQQTACAVTTTAHGSVSWHDSEFGWARFNVPQTHWGRREWTWTSSGCVCCWMHLQVGRVAVTTDETTKVRPDKNNE